LKKKEQTLNPSITALHVVEGRNRKAQATANTCLLVLMGRGIEGLADNTEGEAGGKKKGLSLTGGEKPQGGGWKIVVNLDWWIRAEV